MEVQNPARETYKRPTNDNSLSASAFVARRASYYQSRHDIYTGDGSPSLAIMEFIPFLPIYVPTFLPVSARSSATRVDVFPDLVEDVADEGVGSHPLQLETIADKGPRPLGDKIREPDSEASHDADPNSLSCQSICTLVFILPSGQRQTMSFESDTSVARVKESIWRAWPSDWSAKRPPTSSYLRILHLGKQLKDGCSLASLRLSHLISGCPSQVPVIVHLVISLCPAHDGDKDIPSKNDYNYVTDEAGCSCIIC